MVFVSGGYTKDVVTTVTDPATKSKAMYAMGWSIVKIVTWPCRKPRAHMVYSTQNMKRVRLRAHT